MSSGNQTVPPMWLLMIPLVKSDSILGMLIRAWEHNMYFLQGIYRLDIGHQTQMNLYQPICIMGN